jgi:uncharacterized protein YbjT (DUF2867 family)
VKFAGSKENTMTAPKKITVVGSTGLVGSQLVRLLKEVGHTVVEVSREGGADVLTGEGLNDALAGADAVVDVINSATPEDSAEGFFKQTSANLSAAVSRAKVGHYVVLSIVGVDALAPGAGYMRGKLAQEAAARDAGTPWTVVRSTQFHELTEGIVESLVHGRELRAPEASIQPIASAELVAILARVATGAPLNTIHEVGGPVRMTFAEMARQVLAHQHRELYVHDDPVATYFGLPVDETTLVPAGEAELGTTELAAWLATR